MDAQVLINGKLPELKKEFGLEQIQFEAFTLVLDQGSSSQASYHRNTGSEWILVVGQLPKGIRIESNLGVYDANSLNLQVQQEVHTGQLTIENKSAEAKTIELIRIYE